MAEKLGMTNEVKEIKLGKSFGKSGYPCFHTFRYDFMPASVNTSKRASVDIGEGNQVTVTMPHIEGSGTANTVFKGSKKPYQKECVFIIDHTTGEITLEKLNCNVQLKKTRAEGSSKIKSSSMLPEQHTNNKTSSPANKLSPQQKHHSISFGQSSPIQKCSPLPKSPLNNSQPSPTNTIPPSMPSLSNLSVTAKPVAMVHDNHMPSVSNQDNIEVPEVGLLTSSSSSSNESSSDSESSDNEETNEIKMETETPALMNGHKPPVFKAIMNNHSIGNSLPSMPKFSQLSEDLRLSESDSD